MIYCIHKFDNCPFSFAYHPKVCITVKGFHSRNSIGRNHSSANNRYYLGSNLLNQSHQGVHLNKLARNTRTTDNLNILFFDDPFQYLLVRSILMIQIYGIYICYSGCFQRCGHIQYPQRHNISTSISREISWNDKQNIRFLIYCCHGTKFLILWLLIYSINPMIALIVYSISRMSHIS